jgi:hypothetical protein
VGAEELAGGLVEDDLHEALVLAERDGLAVADEREAADADVDLLFLRRRLGEADRCDLRRAVGAARDLQLPDWMTWLKAQDGEEIAARDPGGGGYAPIEEAPGIYVKMRS